MKRTCFALLMLFAIGSVMCGGCADQEKLFYTFAKALKDGSLFAVVKRTYTVEVRDKDLPKGPPPGLPQGAKYIAGPYDYSSYTFILNTGSRGTLWEKAVSEARSLHLPKDELLKVFDASPDQNGIYVLYVLEGRGYLRLLHKEADGTWKTTGAWELKDLPIDANLGRIGEEAVEGRLIVIENASREMARWLLKNGEVHRWLNSAFPNMPENP